MVGETRSDVVAVVATRFYRAILGRLKVSFVGLALFAFVVFLSQRTASGNSLAQQLSVLAQVLSFFYLFYFVGSMVTIVRPLQFRLSIDWGREMVDLVDSQRLTRRKARWTFAELEQMKVRVDSFGVGLVPMGSYEWARPKVRILAFDGAPRQDEDLQGPTIPLPPPLDTLPIELVEWRRLRAGEYLKMVCLFSEFWKDDDRAY